MPIRIPKSPLATDLARAAHLQANMAELRRLLEQSLTHKTPDPHHRPAPGQPRPGSQVKKPLQ